MTPTIPKRSGPQDHGKQGHGKQEPDQQGSEPATARTRALLAPNLGLLEQASALCDRLDDVALQTSCPELGGSTIGQHLRHCLDHFERFVEGITEGRIDYDNRGRNTGTECCTERAAHVAQDMAARLQAALDRIPADQPLEVAQACDVVGEVLPERSTCGRELQFLVSHTVHHFAMIGGICRQLGMEMPEDFGVAPSTLRYRAENQ